MATDTPPKTLVEAVRYFAVPENCLSYLVATRWPGGVSCPHCHSQGVYFDKTRMGWICKSQHPKRKFSLKTGTIFEDSPIGLDKWLPAVWIIAGAKNGISSHELARALGVTQKTAWFMLHRIRNAAMTKEFNTPPLTGTVEMDECYVGPNPRFQHADKRAKQGKQRQLNKRIVFGMAQRDGDIRLHFVPNTTLKTTIPLVKQHVARGTRVHTDESSRYSWLNVSYAHEFINHSLGQYVQGDVTTNTIEGVFSHFRRTMVGTYHKCDTVHLDRYLQMFAFRWNTRKQGESERVNALLRATQGRRITYQQLTE